MEIHGGTEFQCQKGLGFNLCVVPPLDCGVSILEGKGSARARFWQGQGKDKSARGY